MRFSQKEVLLLSLVTGVSAHHPWWSWPWDWWKHHHHHHHDQAPKPDYAKADAVKEVFQTAWSGYKEYAFPHDNLDPVSNSYDDDRNGWGATAVDALDTAILMEEWDIVHDILKYIPTIDFTTTAVENEEISVFETTIRYIGGMLAGYDLLKGPYSHMARGYHDEVEALLEQAQTLADQLKVAFGTDSGVPDGRVIINPSPPTRGGADSNNAAEVGTLVLEWTHLSDLSGNDEYARLAQAGESYLLHPTGVPPPWPGLLSMDIGTANGEFLNDHGTWSGGMDSAYEYFIKMYLYDEHEFSKNKDAWVEAAKSSQEHLASHPTTRPELTWLASYEGQTIVPSTGHLASFAGGNWILAGVLLDNDEYKEFGLNLTSSFFETYNATTVGIGPESFSWVDNKVPVGEGSNDPPPSDQESFYNDAGFWINNGQYILRPETVESLWYAYRLTGDQMYQDAVWDAFTAIRDATRVGSGYASLKSVMDPDAGYYDKMQSFFLAEALKYCYLTFAEDSEVQFQASGDNKWVFNTEAHPFRVR